MYLVTTNQTNYQIFRGKCKTACEALQKVMPELILVRGWYNQPEWPKNACQHWWLKTPEGVIVDPTALQFPMPHVKEFYEEFDGMCECEECGKKIHENEAQFAGRYPVCSGECYMALVGID